MTKYDDVRVIKTGKVGMVVDIKDGCFLVDFETNSEWYDECDLLPIEEERE